MSADRAPRWQRRLAAHLSIGSLDRPVFAATARSLDPVDQIVACAAAGFAGVSDNMLLVRSRDEQSRMGRALGELGLEMGSISLSPVGTDQLNFTDESPDVDGALAACADAFERLAAGGANVGTVTAMVHQGAGQRSEQLDRATRNLERAARFAERIGFHIGLEAVSRQRVPTSLVDRADDAAAIVGGIGSSALGLVLDSAHAWFAGDDMVEQTTRLSPLLTIQIADMPGRVEPGAGTIDFSGLGTALDAIGWTGLVEAEFFASAPGRRGETAVLRALDARFGKPGRRS